MFNAKFGAASVTDGLTSLSRPLAFAGLSLTMSLTALGRPNVDAATKEARFDGPCWFVDGYHGGVYGHYPLADYTGFMCDQLDANPEWSICLEIEPETWDRIAELAPDQLERLKAHAGTPRVEFTNPTYAQPYLWNLGGESVIRQFEIGLAKLHRHFPKAEVVTYAVEEPCFTSCLPAVLRGFGFKYAVLRCPNTCWGGYPVAYGRELVSMEGPDGTRIVAVPRPRCEALQPGSVWQTKSWGNETDYLEACRSAGIRHPVGMTYQDARWRKGPWLGRGRAVRNGSTYVTWRRYFEEVATEPPTDVWRFGQEDVKPGLMWGAGVMNELARQVRRTESLLVQAEKIMTIGETGTSAGPLDEAWWKLALSQHHDAWIVPTLPCSGLRKRTWADWSERWTSSANALAGEVIDRALSAIAPAAPGGEALLVVNTLGHARTETLEFPATEGAASFAFTAEIPAFGHVAFSRAEAEALARRSARCRVLERTDRRLRVMSGAGELVFDLTRGGTIGGIGELRGHFYEDGGWKSSADTPVAVKVEGDGTPRMSVTVEGTIARSPFVQRYTFTGASALVEGHLRIDWRGNPRIGEGPQDKAAVAKNPRRMFSDDRYKLNLRFPHALRRPRLWKNAAFDVCESREERTWTKSWKDLRHNVVLDWFDVSEGRGGKGLAVFTDHTGAYVFGGDETPALTVQYSGYGLWGCDYSVTGPTEMDFAFLFHDGDWQGAGLERLRLCRAEPPVTRLVRSPAPARSLVRLSNPGFEISSFRRLSEREAELRLYHAAGDNGRCTVSVGLPLAAIVETDLAGHERAAQPSAAEIRADVPLFGFRTYRLRR